MTFLDDIVLNAKLGLGPCEGCPAHKATKGQSVNPGLSNFRGKIIFVTEEPSHDIQWEDHDSWADYSKIYTRKFFTAKGWKGGKWIQKNFLNPLNLSISDVWIADSLKCPSKNKKDGKEAFKHCLKYLKKEINIINPKAIVNLGAPAVERTLMALGVSLNEIKHIKVTKNFGLLNMDTKWPVIISLH